LGLHRYLNEMKQPFI